MAALLPFSIWAADGSGDVSKTGQDTIAEVARIDGQDGAEEIVPVDLDAASEAYDIVLPQQPVHMTADSLVVRSADGYIQGRGNVDLRQGMDELHTSYIEGSTNNQLYHTPGPAVYLTSENALSGTGIIYNSKDGDASMDTIEGFIGPGTYIRGTGAEMVDGVGYVKHGLITTPHAVAKTPDYYITGDDICIYPGEKFTAFIPEKNLRLKIRSYGLSTFAC